MTTPKATAKWRSVLLFVGSWTLVGLAFAALNYAMEISGPRSRGLSYALRMNLIYFYLWAGFSVLIFRLSRRFPVEFQRLRIRNLLLHVPIILLFAIIHVCIHGALAWMLVPFFKQHFTFTIFFEGFIIGGIYLSLLTSSLIVITAHAILYYQNFRAGEAKRSALKAQLVEAQLQALKMQLHPHFLFNTLHSISSLVMEDGPKANNMIARLGDFLRLTLDHSEQQMVTLDQEIEFLRCYLEIEQVRFEDRLTVDFTIAPETLSAFVPHLILQPVVENAIRHGVAPRAAAGNIQIQSTRLNGLLRLEVKDNGPGLQENANPEKHGIGLSNVHARLGQIYGTEYSFVLTNLPAGGLTVVLKIPFQSESHISFPLE